MPARGALVLLLAMLPGIAVAQKADTGAIRYSFKTLVITDSPKERTATVLKVDPWFMARAVPARAVELSGAVAITGTPITLDKGTILSVAESEYFVACSDQVGVKSGVFGDGRLPVCLIDMDRDGVLDSWYRSSVPVTLGRDAGHIQRDDIHPLTPVKSRPLSIEEVRKLPLWGAVTFEYHWGTLTWCVQLNVCKTKQLKIQPAASEQIADYMDGQFAYREIDKKHLAVRLVREPPEWVY